MSEMKLEHGQFRLFASVLDIRVIGNDAHKSTETRREEEVD